MTNTLHLSSPSDLLSIEDVAAALGVCTRTVTNRMKARRIEGACKLGRRWYFDPSVLVGPLSLPG